MPNLNEADTRAKLVDPAIHARGWTEDLIRREVSDGAIDVIEGNPHIFATPEVVQAGGLQALAALGNAADVLSETKRRMFTA